MRGEAVHRIVVAALQTQNTAFENRLLIITWSLSDVIETCLNEKQISSISPSVRILLCIWYLVEFVQVLLPVDIWTDHTVAISPLLKLNIVEMGLWPNQPQELLNLVWLQKVVLNL